MFATGSLFSVNAVYAIKEEFVILRKDVRNGFTNIGAYMFAKTILLSNVVVPPRLHWNRHRIRARRS